MVLVYSNLWSDKLDIIEKIIDHYNIIVKDNIIVYSVFPYQQYIRKNFKAWEKLNKEYKNYKKIFYTGESIFSDKNANYIIGFLPTHDNYIKLDVHERSELSIYGIDYRIYQSLNLNRKIPNKTKFCCFIVSNPNSPFRNNFFQSLSKYKKVDSLGKYKKNSNILDNIKVDTPKYYEVLSQYKFIICFENNSKEYYLTEKIYNAFKANILPIYWGDPNVTDFYNEKTFINIKNNSYNSVINAIELVKKIDQNDDLYNNYFKENPVLNPELHDNRVQNSIDKIRDLLI